ncbi:MAG: type II toxin-antitoxin system VapC family toxin [Armatimonadetes bacterium]|nr:type II toxin-antitoxin system VapC family toxin [Armatimonadota bacterium]
MKDSETSNVSRYVLDSFAILTLLQQEQGWERVRELILDAADGKVELHMSIINLAEVKYLIARRGKNSPQVVAAIEALPINILSADDYIEQVIELKAKYPISLADCFGAAVAIHLSCPLITADPEFKKLEEILQVEWLTADG